MPSGHLLRLTDAALLGCDSVIGGIHISGRALLKCRRRGGQ